jgi:hypothetical protein
MYNFCALALSVKKMEERKKEKREEKEKGKKKE